MNSVLRYKILYEINPLSGLSVSTVMEEKKNYEKSKDRYLKKIITKNVYYIFY